MDELDKHTKIFNAARSTKLLRSSQLIQVILWNKHGHGLTPTEMHELTGLKPSLISSAINTMERQGIITRHHRLRDKRIYRLYLTAQGMESANKIWKAVVKLSDIKNERSKGWEDIDA